MTIPFERTRAVLQTKQFLRALQNPLKYPGVPDEVRREAIHLLRHYPGPWDLSAAHRGAPDWWGPVQESRDPS